MVAKGLIDLKAVESVVQYYEHDTGPRNGAAVVARAWTDPEFKAWLLRDGTEAIHSMGFKGYQGEHMHVVENTDNVHNIIVCTLCSCYPWAVLGLPPAWYKGSAYRSRVVREPRAVLREFGFEVSTEKRLQVWDSTAEIRYMVLPQRPAETDGMDAQALAALVTRDGMIGTAAL